MEVLVILLGFLLFAVSYLFVPVIFCLCGIKLSKSTIITIVIINCVCVTLLFYLLYSYVLAAIIAMGVCGVPWSIVAYLLMKKKCLKEEANLPKIEDVYIPKYTATPIQNTEMRLSPIGETPKNLYGLEPRLQTEEPKPNERTTTEVDIIVRLKTDEEFFNAVKTIYELDKEKLSSLLRIIK